MNLLQDGSVIADRYEILKLVGQGGMQQVYSAKDLLLERVVALKTPINKSAKTRFHRSAVVSSRVNHSSVAKTLDYFANDEREFLIEELVDGMDLSIVRSHVPLCDPHLVAFALHRLARGLAASHHVRVVHRDLKPSNIMVVGGTKFLDFKITDFGIAKLALAELEVAFKHEQSINSSKTALGAIPYMAPEAIDSLKDAKEPSDVWSIGAIAYELLTGEKPFGGGIKAVHAIIEAKLPQKPAIITRNVQFARLANEIYDIACSCLRKNPESRPTADDLSKLCGDLCYSGVERETGTFIRLNHQRNGFLSSENGGNVFFHQDSIYGMADAKIGDSLLFGRFPGLGADRAFPIVRFIANPDARE